MLYPLDKTSSNSFAYYLSISNLNWSKEYLARSWEGCGELRIPESYKLKTQ